MIARLSKFLFDFQVDFFVPAFELLDALDELLILLREMVGLVQVDLTWSNAQGLLFGVGLIVGGVLGWVGAGAIPHGIVLKE